ncbi:43028_t:CDS:1, partial [Gigaspora margarita]
ILKTIPRAKTKTYQAYFKHQDRQAKTQEFGDQAILTESQRKTIPRLHRRP